jgi:hypothetical protein
MYHGKVGKPFAEEIKGRPALYELRNIKNTRDLAHNGARRKVQNIGNHNKLGS